METLSEDDDDRYLCEDGDDHSIGSFLIGLSSGCSSGTFKPSPGGPLSALTPSMWPQDILAKLAQPEDVNEQLDFRYDEFGFRVEEEGNYKMLSMPPGP